MQAVASHLRDDLVAKIPAVIPEDEVEANEVYVVAGHKGNPAAMQKKAGPGDADGLKGRAAETRWKRKSRRSWARLAQGSAKRSLMEWPDEG